MSDIPFTADELRKVLNEQDNTITALRAEVDRLTNYEEVLHLRANNEHLRATNERLQAALRIIDQYIFNGGRDIHYVRTTVRAALTQKEKSDE